MTATRLRPVLHLALLAAAAATALCVVIDTQSPVRVIVALVALALLPGAAILALLPPIDPPAWFGLAVGLSLAVDTLGALAMVWLSWWHPGGLALVLGAASAAVLGWDLHRHHRDRTGSPGRTSPGQTAAPQPAEVAEVAEVAEITNVRGPGPPPGGGRR